MSSEWQPIETAPHDKPILGYGIWQGEIHGIDDRPAIYILIKPSNYRTDHDDREGWWSVAGGDAYASWCLPTHWVPLPDPPKTHNAD